MTEVELPLDDAGPTRRGRLQRRLRRDRGRATYHAVIGTVVTLVVVMAFGHGPSGPPQLPAASEDGDVRFTAAMVGDLMFGRHVERVIERHGHAALLAPTAPLLEGDYVSGNLEQVISDREDLPEADKLIHLRSGTDAAQALADAGFTTVSLANNHTMDHGIPGLRDTIEALDAVGIEHAGAGLDLEEAMSANLQDHDGLVVATLSFTDTFVEGFVARAFQGGVLEADPDIIVPMVQRVRADADLVIVHFHWGEEYDIRVSSDQRELAEITAAAGADIIVGHHAHVLLPVERIGNTLVLYSLGNFVFDQGWSRTRETAVARYLLREDGTARIELTPAYIREATPRPLSGVTATYRQERIFQRLAGDGFDWDREGNRLVTEIDHRHVVEAQP